jgi:S-layer family protein
LPCGTDTALLDGSRGRGIASPFVRIPAVFLVIASLFVPAPLLAASGPAATAACNRMIIERQPASAALYWESTDHDLGDGNVITERDGNYSFVRWTPGGGKILSYENTGDVDELVTFDPDGTNRAVAATSATRPERMWSQSDELYAVRSSPGEPWKIVDLVGNLIDESDQPPFISPTGDRYATVETDGLFIHEIASGRVIPVADRRADGDPDWVSIFGPSWSPDGGALAWWSGSNDGVPDEAMWVASADGTRRRRLGGAEDSNVWAAPPRWSPDGLQLFWPSGDGNNDITTNISSPNGQARVFGTGEWMSPQAWNYNGTRLAVTRVNEFAIIDVATGEDWFTLPGRHTFATATDGTFATRKTSRGVELTIYDPSGQSTAVIPNASVDFQPCGAPEVPCPTTITAFIDVDSASFALNDVTCLFALGITTGTSANTFNPTGTVTREQMAAFIARTWRQVG